MRTSLVMPRQEELNVLPSFFANLHFHLPNFLLAAVMYTLLGRVLLNLFVDQDPIIAVVAMVTPKAAAPVVLWLFGFVWLFWLRVVFLYVYALLGILPRVS
jgi:YggT family protein